MNNFVLSLKNISKDFIQGSICIEILKDVNLDVRRGEIVAIIGASGSGKSTLLQIAGLLDQPSCGDVIINDIKTLNISYQEKAQIRLKKIGFVYQYHHLLRDFSARENIAMPLLISGDNYDSAISKADEYLIKLGMEKRKFHFPGQLSGGEQQRVAIARSMINNPDLILADEPTGNLDPCTGEQVFQLFFELSKLNNTATVIVTHNYELAKKADRVIELKMGSFNTKSHF